MPLAENVQESEPMGFCHLRVCLCGIIVVMMTVSMTPASGETGTAFQPPPYRLNRADEDYRYLRDPARRTDFWDPVKYVPLNDAGQLVSLPRR